MKKKIISCLTAVALCAGITAPVFADEITEVPAPAAEITAEDVQTETPEEMTEQEDNTADTEEISAESEDDTAEDAAPAEKAEDTSETVDENILINDEAEFGVQTGRFGKNNCLTWTYDEGTRKLSITGSGEMPNIYKNDQPWANYRTSIRTLSIGSGVTAIGNNSFNGCTDIDSVYMAASVDTIGNYAFEDCVSLTSVNIPDANIAYQAFSGCTSLGTLTFSGGTEERYIGGSAFYNCDALESVNLPGNVTSLGTYCFESCDSLRSAVIPGSIKTVPIYTFENCISLERVVMGEGVQTIDSYAFYGCKRLTGVKIPSTMTDINHGVFQKCETLQTITLSNANIGNYVFDGCASLVKVQLPGGTADRTIGSCAFRDCKKLVNISIPDNIISLGSSCFSGCESLQEIIIPDRIREIPENAFTNCKSLVSVKLPDDLTNIGNSAFSYCTALRTISIPHANIGSSAFSNCKLLSNVTIKDGTAKRTIGSFAFVHCESLTSITLPDSIISIGYNAFEYCYALTKALLPEGLVTIESDLFYGDKSLVAVNIPKSVVTIKSGAFKNCPLTHIHIASGKTAADYSGQGGLPTDTSYYFTGGKGKCSDANCPFGAAIKVPAVAFDVKGVFGGREVTFRANGSTDKNIKIYYTTENRSTLKLTDKCVNNGDTVLWENYYGTVYARAYINGTWGNVSRLILKIPVVNKPTITRNKDQVTIKTTTPDSYIIYTTDGTKPSLTNGKRVKSPVTITVKKNTRVRAIAVRSCFTNSEETSLRIYSIT